jgi:hypothetical protein
MTRRGMDKREEEGRVDEREMGREEKKGERRRRER